ncbi:MAG: hypothetical protein K6T66_04340 [Peptococcaceae bacterium]|nr:hypothetical protein [Peptococcaceae bacterium]
MSFKPAGLLTGIGSVPYTDPAEALSLIFSNMPEIPHWPQMPLRGPGEGFVFQFLTPLVRAGLIRIEGGRAYFDTESDRWGEGMTEFYAAYLAAAEGDPEALEAFSLPEEAAAGFYAFSDHIREKGPGDAVYFKGHLAGPLTVGFNLKDAGGRLAYYQDQLRDLLVKTLALHGRWQAVKLAALGRPAIIFVDEPGISVYGKSSYITVTREMIKKDLNEIFGQIHAAGALAGVHSCDAIDWSILYQCDLEIVNLDAYNFGDSLIPFSAGLKEFILRGGILAQGIVPTSGEAFAETAESLIGRLEGIWDQLRSRGVPGRRLIEQTMITPACGTGLLDPGLAARIYRLAREVSGAVRESIGA